MARVASSPWALGVVTALDPRLGPATCGRVAPHAQQVKKLGGGVWGRIRVLVRGSNVWGKVRRASYDASMRPVASHAELCTKSRLLGFHGKKKNEARVGSSVSPSAHEALGSATTPSLSHAWGRSHRRGSPTCVLPAYGIPVVKSVVSRSVVSLKFVLFRSTDECRSGNKCFTCRSRTEYSGIFGTTENATYGNSMKSRSRNSLWSPSTNLDWTSTQNLRPECYSGA